MKIEKLTDNKIRILLRKDDITEKNVDLKTLMTCIMESRGFLLNILNEAEEQLGFNTDGCKLLIEANISEENDFVFTITKYLNQNQNVNPLHNSSRKKAVPRKISTEEFIKKYKKSHAKKENAAISSDEVFRFNNFDAFWNMCIFLNSSIILYELNNTYYLLLKGVQKTTSYKRLFHILTEFGYFYKTSPLFENKLTEYGKLVFKHNALSKGMKFFK